MTTFEWNGARFLLRPMSGMDQELYAPLLVDVANAVCKARGLDIDNLPRTLDKLIVTFVKWAQVTTIEGDSLLHDCNLITGDAVAYFDAWMKAVTTDQQLWSMWSAAYEDANRAKSDPLAEKDAPPVAAE